MDAWNPKQYNRFQSERAQPFWDLASLVSFSEAKRLLDVGCGTGELTAALHRQSKVPFTLGIDSSGKMLEEARRLSGDGLFFEQASVESFAPKEPFDIVFSNAALQWVENHRQLFPRLFSWVKPGGQLAVQMPANFDHPSHMLAEELAAKFGLSVRRTPVLPMEDYAHLLDAYGAHDIRIEMRLYLHQMESARGVVEWTKGTLLTYYEKQLTPERYEEFLSEYTARLMHRLGDGPYLYPFKRLLLFARINPRTDA